MMSVCCRVSHSGTFNLCALTRSFHFCSTAPARTWCANHSHNGLCGRLSSSHEGGVDVAGIIVADEREVEQVLALVAAGEWLILIEAQHRMAAVAGMELQQA